MTAEPAATCVFCQIAAGEAPASVVYTDSDVIAFLDIRPVNAGHVLVIPRAHAVGLADLDPMLGGRLFQVAQQVAAAVRATELRCEGVNFFLADGVAAGQEVFHAHLHVLPRFTGDGFGISAAWSWPDRATLDGIAADLRATPALRTG